MRNYSENIMKVVFLVAACVSIIAVVLICVFPVSYTHLDVYKRQAVSGIRSEIHMSASLWYAAPVFQRKRLGDVRGGLS